jgi:GNAT superfamily N-acetyltransferase
MTPGNPPLPAGYSALPVGHIATAVTYLEMTAKPARKLPPTPPHLRLQPLSRSDLSAYRRLFRAVGEDWLWCSRLVMDDGRLSAILQNPAVESYALVRGEQAVGLLELDFGAAGQCELAYFGLVADAIGQGLGRYLMDQAIARAWSQPIRRFWVHTCSFDHPGALAFYRRSGFRPYALAVEVLPDPRLSGLLPRSAAPHVPLLDPAQPDG